MIEGVRRVWLVVALLVACGASPTAPTAGDEGAIPPYRRSEWPHWTGRCPDTRDHVLRDESTVSVTLSADGCRVVAGSWLSDYDGETVTAPSALDIDHLVPLAEAHRSGGWRWSRDRKRAYANDLTDPWHLLAVTARSNRQKGDQDPARWRPRREAWCRYARAWRGIKMRWQLVSDAAEARALAEMEGTCPS